LEPAVLKLEAMTITGQREGDAVSIIRRKNAGNITNIISMDAYGNVADGNIGNFLINLPGLASTAPGGEVKGITVRGMTPELNAVSVDGVRAAAASAGYSEMGDRAALLDEIPSEFIKEIEVTKALLPEQPADSLGGSINLVQKHPSDFRRRVVTYSAGLFHNIYRDGNNDFSPTLSFTYIDKLKKAKNLSFSISASYNEQGFVPSDLIQTTYNSEYYPLAYVPDPGNPDDPGRPGWPVDPSSDRVSQIRMLAATLSRVRAGADFAVVYEFDKTASVWLKARYTYFSSETDRTDYRYYAASSAAMEYDPAHVNITTINHARWTNNALHEDKRSDQGLIIAGLRKEWPDASFKFQASYNPTKFSNRIYRGDAVMRNFSAGDYPVIEIDTSDRRHPVYRQLSGPSNEYGRTDFSLYRFNYAERPEDCREDMADANMHYEKRGLFLGMPVIFKTGVDYRRQHRAFGYSDITYVYNHAARQDVGKFMTGSPGYGLFNGRYPSYDVVNLHFTRMYFQVMPGDFDDYQGRAGTPLPDSVITEGVLGTYAQAQLGLGRLSVLAGIRHEWTNLSSGGSSYELAGQNDNQLITNITTRAYSTAYGNLFPSAHLRYEPVPDLVLRGSFSTGIARPALKYLTPTTTVDNAPPDDGGPESGWIIENNPDLKPQYSRNYDISLEYYINPGGILSIGGFQKDIKNYLMQTRDRVGSGPDNGFNGKYANYAYSTWLNMGHARVRGVEIEYKQRLTFLPKPLNTLYLFGGYTRLRTEGVYNDNATELAGFIPEVWTAGASFSWRGLELRAIYRYTGDNLFNYSTVRQNIFWRAGNGTWDANLQYRLRSWLAFYVDVVNAGNDYPERYSQLSRRISVYEKLGTRLNLGVKGRF
ncbi:MAG: TonB-dependent receptor, partial [Opitutaceae bacterium]|nr:TonB-dependent receptor [Opitutaceae bacterium]